MSSFALVSSVYVYVVPVKLYFLHLFTPLQGSLDLHSTHWPSQSAQNLDHQLLRAACRYTRIKWGFFSW